MNINNIRICKYISQLGYVKVYISIHKGGQRMVQSLVGLRDKVMLAHACTIDYIEMVSILLFIWVARWPA